MNLRQDKVCSKHGKLNMPTNICMKGTLNIFFLRLQIKLYTEIHLVA